MAPRYYPGLDDSRYVPRFGDLGVPWNYYQQPQPSQSQQLAADLVSKASEAGTGAGLGALGLGGAGAGVSAGMAAGGAPLLPAAPHVLGITSGAMSAAPGAPTLLGANMVSAPVAGAPGMLPAMSVAGPLALAALAMATGPKWGPPVAKGLGKFFSGVLGRNQPQRKGYDLNEARQELDIPLPNSAKFSSRGDQAITGWSALDQAKKDALLNTAREAKLLTQLGSAGSEGKVNAGGSFFAPRKGFGVPTDVLRRAAGLKGNYKDDRRQLGFEDMLHAAVKVGDKEGRTRAQGMLDAIASALSGK